MVMNRSRKDKEFHISPFIFFTKGVKCVET
jgi:hypothetical protein